MAFACGTRIDCLSIPALGYRGDLGEEDLLEPPLLSNHRVFNF